MGQHLACLVQNGKQASKWYKSCQTMFCVNLSVELAESVIIPFFALAHLFFIPANKLPLLNQVKQELWTINTEKICSYFFKWKFELHLQTLSLQSVLAKAEPRVSKGADCFQQYSLVVYSTVTVSTMGFTVAVHEHHLFSFIFSLNGSMQFCILAPCESPSVRQKNTLKELGICCS